MLLTLKHTSKLIGIVRKTRTHERKMRIFPHVDASALSVSSAEKKSRIETFCIVVGIKLVWIYEFIYDDEWGKNIVLVKFEGAGKWNLIFHNGKKVSERRCPWKNGVRNEQNSHCFVVFSEKHLKFMPNQKQIEMKALLHNLCSNVYRRLATFFFCARRFVKYEKLEKII